jgi:DNA adenine methylase
MKKATGLPRARGRTTAAPHPFLKWVGGKGQLTKALVAVLPPRYRQYIEPFVGGGALFFALQRAGLLEKHRCILADINTELIDAYRAIQTDVEAVIRILHEYHHTKDDYYRVRAQDPATLSLSERCARMIYLNRTGYNGLYRVNRSGRFNVPFGRYVNPTICDPVNLRAVARALHGVELVDAPFEEVLARTKRHDLVYCDPPYVPLTKTANFVTYASGGFSLQHQRELAKACLAAAQRDVYIVASNSDTPTVHDLYNLFPRRVPVKAWRRVNSRADRRGPVGELIITSYSPDGVH